MVTFKLVIGTKDGRCLQKELGEPAALLFLGKKIGDDISGDNLGFPGYEFKITGGSDYCGFPMRADLPGIARKKILAVSGVGIKRIGKGIRQRKTVCGNTIHPKISQINLKVVKEGKEPLLPPLPAKEKKEAEKEAEPEKEK